MFSQLTRIAMASAIMALGGVCAVASARTVTAYNIVSPTKLISCYAVQHSTAIECMASYIPRVFPEGDPLVAVSAHGKSRYGARSDFPGFTTPRRTLRYGDTWKRPGIRCTMRTTGMTCRNSDGHGFHLQKGHTYRF
jgi:hypothetical protein